MERVEGLKFYNVIHKKGDNAYLRRTIRSDIIEILGDWVNIDWRGAGGTRVGSTWHGGQCCTPDDTPCQLNTGDEWGASWGWGRQRWECRVDRCWEEGSVKHDIEWRLQASLTSLEDVGLGGRWGERGDWRGWDKRNLFYSYRNRHHTYSVTLIRRTE